MDLKKLRKERRSLRRRKEGKEIWICIPDCFKNAKKTTKIINGGFYVDGTKFFACSSVKM